MTARGAGPVGLGGWLWPVTWLSAVMPVAWWTYCISLVARVSPNDPEWLWLMLAPWRVAAAVGVHLLGAALATWWSVRWFARGPRNWSNGGWWQAGVLGVAAVLLARELIVVAGFASTPVPPPPAAGPGNAVALAQILHPGDEILAAREALWPIAAAAATWMLASWGRLRRARWTGAALIAAIIFAGIAAWHLRAHYCCALIDELTRPLGPTAWAALLIVALATRAWRSPGPREDGR